MKTLVLFLLTINIAYAQSDIECMSQNIYHEARSEGKHGWVAVGKVTLNRVESRFFPDTICEVVWQHKQFSWTANKNLDIIETKVYSRIKNIAHLMLNYDVVSPVGDSLYYHADTLFGKKEKFVPYWAKHKEKVVKFGRHVFYRRK